jgi:hypothetical protein
MEKICKTCKHWINFNNLAGECNRLKRCIDGDFVDTDGKVISEQYPKEPYDFPELNCDFRITNLSIYVGDGYETEDYDPSDLFGNVRVLFGSAFGCNQWELKE